MKPVEEAKTLTLQDLLERDKDKIQKTARNTKATVVDPEDEMLAEFGLYFGWEAIWAVKTNSITANDMQTLTMGARKVNAANRYNEVVDMYTAFAATQTKEGGKALKERLSEIRKI